MTPSLRLLWRILPDWAGDYSKSAVLLDKMFSERKDITDQERTILASIKQTEARTMPMIERVSELRLAGDLDQAKEVMLRDARPAFIIYRMAGSHQSVHRLARENEPG